MDQKAGIRYRGAIYHVTDREGRLEPIFGDEPNMDSRGHLAWLLQPRVESRLSAPANQRLLGI